jgi:hypothetical protein
MMYLDTVTEMLLFLALGTLVVATLAAALATLRSSRRAERLGEDRLVLLRDQQERLELLREERRVLTEELELERRERLEAQSRVKQLMREHPHLELERELQRVTEERELEREGRLHNHSERQKLSEELEAERLARSEDQRNARRLEQELWNLEALLREYQKTPNKKRRNGLWATLFRRKDRQGMLPTSASEKDFWQEQS